MTTTKTVAKAVDETWGGPVPAAVRTGDDFLVIQRAWPHERRAGGVGATLTVEGRDEQGRLRAGRLELARADTPSQAPAWRVRAAHVAPAGADPKLAGLATVAEGHALVVHRFGKRAVVRRESDYVKVVRRGRGPGVAEQARRGWELSRASGFGAPEVMAEGADQVRFAILPGQNLHELGPVTDLPTWSATWQQWGGQWRVLTSLSATDLAPHTPEDEVRVLQRWVGLAEDFAALPAGLLSGLRARADRVCAELLSGAAQELVVSHRDLHDKQILAAGDSLGLLDFDTAALAEPALDLANLWVHASLRQDQRVWSREHAGVVQEVVTGLADQLNVAPERFQTYAAATRVRLACLYAFRPAHRDLALAWAGVAHNVA